MSGTIKNISISGYKSIRELTEFELRDLNIAVGANGAGKSNFVQVFHLLTATNTLLFSSRYTRRRQGPGHRH